MMKKVIRNLTTGVILGLAVILVVGIVGVVRADMETALRWSSTAGFLLGAVFLVFAGMRWFSADKDGGQYFRPGRTALELEAEVLNEHRDQTKGGIKSADHKGSSIWMAIGVLLTGLIPELLLMIL